MEEPTAPVARELKEETSNTPVDDGVEEQKPEEEKFPEGGDDVASSEAETFPEVPAKEMQQLEIAVDDEKEVDTADVPANTEARTEISVTEVPPEKNVAVVEESNTPAEEVEDQYKHLKVTLTLPEQDKIVPKEENGEKPTEKDIEDEKTVPDRAKDDKERDSDSGSGSAADNSSVDLNLSISSFLSKTKEPGSVSIQVTRTAHTLKF